MEQLYNRDILAPDIEDLGIRLQNTPLDDPSVENEIVAIIEEMIANLSLMADDAEFSLLFCTMMSGDEVNIRRSHINAVTPPSISIPNISLVPQRCEHVSGVIGVSNASSAYDDYFWKEGDNVDITNKAFSTYGLVDFLDVMVTTDISKSIFLGRESGEVLDSCYVTGVTGPVSPSTISTVRVIPYKDLNRTYHDISTPIDMAIKGLTTPYIRILNSTAQVSDRRAYLSNMAECNISSGIVLEVDIGSKFLSSNGILDNNAITPINTNIASIEYASTLISDNNAPKNGWKQTDVTREGVVDAVELDEIVSATLGQHDIPQMHRPVVFADINTILAQIGTSILSMEGCE
jgi:hypothetical protein